MIELIECKRCNKKTDRESEEGSDMYWNSIGNDNPTLCYECDRRLQKIIFEFVNEDPKNDTSSIARFIDMEVKPPEKPKYSNKIEGKVMSHNEIQKLYLETKKSMIDNKTSNNSEYEKMRKEWNKMAEKKEHGTILFSFINKEGNSKSTIRKNGKWKDVSEKEFNKKEYWKKK